AGVGKTFRGTFDIGAGNGAPWTASLHEVEIDIELASECAHGRQGLRRSRGCARRAVVVCWRPASVDLADYGARVFLRAFRERDERRANLDQIALCSMQVRNATAPGRGH